MQHYEISVTVDGLTTTKDVTIVVRAAQWDDEPVEVASHQFTVTAPETPGPQIAEFINTVIT